MSTGRTVLALFHIGRRILSSDRRLLRYKIYEIMDMKYISAGENSLNIRLKTLIDLRSGCHRVHVHAHSPGYLILRDQSDGEKQRITAVFLFRSGNRLSFSVYLGQCNSFQSLFSLDVHHRMAQL